MFATPRLRRRPTAVPVTLLVTVALLLGTGTASGAVPSQGELDQAHQQAERLDELVATAEDDLRDVREELVVLEERLAEAGAELEVAVAAHDASEAAATEASDRARAAEIELADANRELESNRETLNGLARDTFKYGVRAGSPALAAFEMLDGPSEGLSDRLHYLQRGVDVRAAALEASTALRTRVTVLTDRAQDEERELQRREAEAETARVAAATLHAEVEQLTSDTSDNLARSAQLVATLESEQQDVAVRITELEEQVRREREEAERRERERRERERAEQLERERAERERAAQQRRQRDAARSSSGGSDTSSSGGSGSGGGSSGGGSSGGGNSGGGSSGGGSVSVRPGPTPALRTVGGITVAASLAPQLEALLNHARRDGISMGGGGYRSPEITAQLRRVNGCPDVYASPASSCRVPTARPGSSEHEKGLAVDFTYRGQTICFPRSSNLCSGNAAFDWLRRNAGSYGLRNLSTEAWHWSTTGR